MTCAADREVYECESGTSYVVFKHRDDRSECEHPIDGQPPADENRARWWGRHG